MMSEKYPGLEESVGFQFKMEGMTEERLAEVAAVTFEDIREANFAQAHEDTSVQRLLADILFFHPEFMVRHEVAFLIGQMKLESLTHYLMYATRYDKNVVVQHEAGEALSAMKSPEMAAFILRFLERRAFRDLAVFRPEGIHHPAVIGTLRHTEKRLREALRS